MKHDADLKALFGYRMQLCGDIVIEILGADAARRESAMLVFTGKDVPSLVGGFGDRFVRTAIGRRFAERRGRLSC